MMKNNYLLKSHDFYVSRVSQLKEQIKKLKSSLSKDEYIHHEVVKFAARLRNATLEIILQDPNRMEYHLHGDLKGYRRYKQGLQRYRLFFAFAASPPLILYLYINDEKHLRKEGDKNDAYEEFKKMITKGFFSGNPRDPKIQKWIHEMDEQKNNKSAGALL